MFAVENVMKARIWGGALKFRLAVCRLDLDGARLDSAALTRSQWWAVGSSFGHQQARPLWPQTTIFLKDFREIIAPNMYPDRLKSAHGSSPTSRPETDWEVTSCKRLKRKKMRMNKQENIWKFPKCQSAGLQSTCYRASHLVFHRLRSELKCVQPHHRDVVTKRTKCLIFHGKPTK